VVLGLQTVGPEIMATRENTYRYPIPLCRQGLAEILLNLALSSQVRHPIKLSTVSPDKTINSLSGALIASQTTTAVIADAKLHAAVVFALADEENLTNQAKKKLSDFCFHVKQQASGGGRSESPRATTSGAAADGSDESTGEDEHLMLSYCWNQQKQVIKIREALGRKHYNVWIDVEQVRTRPLFSSRGLCWSVYKTIYRQKDRLGTQRKKRLKERRACLCVSFSDARVDRRRDGRCRRQRLLRLLRRIPRIQREPELPT
jgi:hypothetical protein